MDRRGFIQNAGRATLLAGLAAIAGVLVSRRQITGDQACSNNLQCRNCRKLTDCELPEAAKTRDDGTEG
jgi:hypothetical protein